MNWFFDLLLFPFRSLHPLWGQIWISALTGILMILIFKKTSDQQSIAELRQRMGSRALGMLLYLESPRTVLKLALGLITDNFVYLWHLLRPMLVIAVPFILVAAQLDARYGRIPPTPDRPSTLTITWKDAVPEAPLPEPSMGSIVSPVVIIPDSLEQSFSFTGENGVFQLEETGISIGSSGGSGSIVTRGSEGRGIIPYLLRPWNAVAPGDIHSARAFLQPARYSILGGRWSWFAVFLVFSSVWAILGAVVFRVKV